MSITTKDGRVFAFKDGEYSLVVNEALDLNQSLTHSISIHDIDLSPGQVVNITSPYSTGTQASNSLVHPTIIRHSIGVDGSPYIMAVTPFAGADDATENPCIFVSDDLLTWRVPTGVANPIFPQPSAGYNSDTHIYEHSDGYTYLIWREYVAGSTTTIYGSRSADGIIWSTKAMLLQDDPSLQDWASPSFWHDGTSWVIVSHNIASSNAIRRLEKTGALLTSWVAVTPTTLTNAHPNSLSWWHSDIRRLPNGRLIALALDGGTGGGPSTGAGGAGGVWLWQSDNAGVTWSVRQILRGKVGYRSSLIIDGASLNVMLVWVDALADGTPTYTEMALHPLRPGRTERRRLNANLQSVVTYTISIDDEPSFLTYVDGFAGGAADLTAPWTQVTGVAMRRNGSGVAVAAGTGAAAAVMATGAVDHWARVQLAAYTAGESYLIVKYVNSTNYVAIGIPAATGKLAVKAFVAGVATIDEAFLLTPSLAAGIVVRAVVDGLKLRVYIDGVLAYERALPAALATGASAGIFCSGATSSTFDVFACGRL